MKVVSRPKSASAQKAHQQWERGVFHLKKQDWHAAIQAFEAAVKIKPDDALYRLNAARCCLELARLEEGLAHANRAAELEPASDVAVFMRVRAMHRLGLNAEILQVLASMPESQRNSREYWVVKGCALQNTGRHQESIHAFMEALQFNLDDAMSHYRMGISFYEMELKEEASECFRTGLVLGLGQNTLHVHGMLAYAERENCRWPQALEQEAQLRNLVSAAPNDAGFVTAPFAHITLMDDPIHQRKACTLMSNTWLDLKPVVRPPRISEPHRLRIGYLSSDFRHHATCVLMCEVFEHHDRHRFEVFAYSTGRDDGTPMRRRVVQAVEHFEDLQGQPDHVIAQRIAHDDLDLLIDLKGYTAGNRMGVLARRPAPLQAAFLGFPGTTGASFIDYIVGDPLVTPLANADHFSEHIAQMPLCYQPNDRQRPRPESMTRSQVGLPEDALVLCGFNQAYKINAEVLDAWVSVLKDLPEAVLWLLDWHGQAKPHLLEELAQRGIGPDRVFWAPRRDLGPHISRVRLADLFIDTWPCNAHTTASDALWAGLPVVTMMGRTFASRVAASLLNAVGLPELICTDTQQYIRTIVEIARDPVRRQAMRDRLDQAREDSALFDSARFTRDYESLLTRMIERQRAGLAPQALPAA
jgi:predicted O-linked N-acetylglucosamine transferase (SPINDLY family)